MQSLHLLVEDEYIESFVNSLEKDKVIIIESNFEQNKEKLNDVLVSYTEKTSDFIPYGEVMKEIGSWLKEKSI